MKKSGQTTPGKTIFIGRPRTKNNKAYDRQKPAVYDWCYIAALIINNVRSPDLFAQYGGI